MIDFKFTTHFFHFFQLSEDDDQISEQIKNSNMKTTEASNNFYQESTAKL